jgi:hypothetical protein
LWWYRSIRPFGTYNLWCDARKKPMVDWQLESSIQDSVVMVSDGKKLNAASKRIIRSFLQRWQQDSDEEEGDLEPEELPVNEEMDID